MTNFECVRKFMETFGQEVKEKAEFPEDKITSLRHDLIEEELKELKEAINNKDIKEVADAFQMSEIMRSWPFAIQVTFGTLHTSYFMHQATSH